MRSAHPKVQGSVAAPSPLDHFFPTEGFSCFARAIRVVLVDPLLIAAALDVLYPLGIVQIPFNRLADAGFEGFFRSPA
ncbi:hypothetical protein D3C78_1593720 [compost metagenome]